MKPANFVIIMTDQHSKKMLGPYGHSQVKTPNLDRFAEEGVRFTSAYTNSPLCVPARSGFATGRYIHETKCWDNGIAYRGDPQGWQHILPDAGHRCVSIGKLHFRSDDDPIGFDERQIPMHIADGVGDVQGCIRPELPVRHQSKALAEQLGPGETGYTNYDRDITERSVAWLENIAANPPDKPWVLFVSYICPHFPLSAPKEYYDLYDPADIEIPKPADWDYFRNHGWWRAFHDSITFDEFFTDDDHRRKAIANYFGLITYADENVGKVVEAVTDTGLDATTRVAYLADHGDSMGARSLWGKSTMFEESVGIPLMLKGPGIPKNESVATPVSLADFHPTLLQTVGLAPDASLPGNSLLETANTGDDDERVVFSEYHGAGAISAVYMLRQGAYKYVHYTGFPPELFNLNEDPEELINLADDPSEQQRVSDFEKRLRSMIDPEAINAEAMADQAAYVEANGGRDAILNEAPIHGTPVPGGESTRVT
ncbi:MAG: sulfatase [Rhodospirillaceae bacterium]|nr:sulfatase [Rhodospirillaceae bacterium]HAA91063.1 sulfatase [Rhodospirillaceae bacterium]